MKAALDTNAMIDLCRNDVWTDRAIRHFLSNQGDTLVLIVQARDELDEHRLGDTEDGLDAGLAERARANLRRLEASCAYDEQRYFTIGVSTLGGPDVLRGHTATHDGIQKETSDIQGAYERYRRRQEASGLPVKSIERSNNKNNNQADAVIYERATELGCDFLVTRDRRIRQTIPATNSCQAITLADFIAQLAN